MSYVEKGDLTEGRQFLQEHSPVIIAKTGSESYNSGLLTLYAAEAKKFEKERDYTRAEQLLREALTISPNERTVIINLASVLGKVEKPDEARKLLETASSNCNDEPCRNDYATALARQKQIEKIVDRLETGR
jgi:Flp pilus assembly protein TadD